jgi:DNA-binding Xre family transcriptional regulator
MTPADEWARVIARAQALTIAEIARHGDQQTLAKKAGISKAHITNLKKGASVGVDAVLRLCTAAGVSFRDLVVSAIDEAPAHATPLERAARRLSGIIRHETITEASRRADVARSEREWVLLLVGTEALMPPLHTGSDRANVAVETPNAPRRAKGKRHL